MERPSVFHFSISVIFFLLLQSCEVFLEEQSELKCSRQPIVALAGDDVILPCRLEPPISASSETVVWTKPGLDPKYIHVRREGRPMYHSRNRLYNKRTALFADQLINGNVSLKLFRVKISDAGKYFCILQPMQKEASIQLNAGAVSTPILEVVTNNSGEVVLQCKSKGWYPEPEVLWLDGEGNLLSVGPTETVRGPDELYTVSNRVTVEKRHSNSFTCRVQQKNINQTTETHIHVPGDFFMVKSSSNWIFAIIGVILLLILTGCCCTKMIWNTVMDTLKNLAGKKKIKADGHELSSLVVQKKEWENQRQQLGKVERVQTNRERFGRFRTSWAVLIWSDQGKRKTELTKMLPKTDRD